MKPKPLPKRGPQTAHDYGWISLVVVSIAALCAAFVLGIVLGGGCDEGFRFLNQHAYGAECRPQHDLCTHCGQPAKAQVTIRREGPVIWDDVHWQPERTFRDAGKAWRCWGCQWNVNLPPTEADRRVSRSVCCEHGWEYVEP